MIHADRYLAVAKQVGDTFAHIDPLDDFLAIAPDLYLRRKSLDPNKPSDYIEMGRRCAVARWFVKSFCEWDETQSRRPGESYCTDWTV